MKIINEELLEKERIVKFHAGISKRILIKSDNLGFGFTKTTIFPEHGKVMQHYKHHLEACYCIQGKAILSNEDGMEYFIEPGVTYVLDQNDKHWFEALEETVLLCIWNPPLHGKEIHRKDGSYSLDGSNDND
jgi:L-ectoine synthase